jgi:NADH-quinone oxidoreductase subunit J
VYAAGRVVTARNPVHAALHLVLAFFTCAGLWLLLEAEFLAIVLVLVYVGAVMVLFLFVVMMLDINTAPLREGFIRYLPVGLAVAALMLFEMVAIVGVRYFGPDSVAIPRVIPRATATPRSWVACSIPITSIPSRSPRSSCWWPSSPPSC